MSCEQLRIGNVLTDEFSDEFRFNRTFEMARWEKGGEFSVAIEEEAFFRFDDFGDGSPGKKRGAGCARFRVHASAVKTWCGRLRARKRPRISKLIERDAAEYPEEIAALDARRQRVSKCTVNASLSVEAPF